MVEANDVIAWVGAFVALWWAIDWLNMRQEGEPLPLRREPLRVLADVARKLWRNKTFLAVLLALWLIGAAVFAVEASIARLTHPGSPPSAAPLLMRGIGLTDMLPELLTRELPDALPRLVEVPLGSWGAMLFAVLLSAGLIRVATRPPEAIGRETARRLLWPAALLGVFFIASIAILAAGREFMESLGFAGRIPPPRTILWMVGTVVLLPVLLAPAQALLWRLVLEIARGGVWSFTSALRAIADAWAPIALILLAVNALRLLGLLWVQSASIMGYVYAAALIMLALVPFAVVDEQAGLIAALRRTWRLFRQRPVDVIAFGLRFALLFAVLGGIVALVEPHSATRWAAWYAPLLDLVRYALTLLQVAVLAGLYVHLSGLLEEGDACASCPSVRLGEELQERVGEEQ